MPRKPEDRSTYQLDHELQEVRSKLQMLAYNIKSAQIRELEIMRELRDAQEHANELNRDAARKGEQRLQEIDAWLAQAGR